MTLAAEVSALRSGCGLSRLDHVNVLRLSGPDAFRLLSVASSRRLFVREGQLCQTLLLAPDGSILADAFVASGQDDALYLLAEGPSETDLMRHFDSVKAQKMPDARVSIEPLSESFEFFGLDGPYAWEVAAAAFGPVVLGMPYLTLMHLDDVLLLRAGKTGEYGYVVIVSRENAEAVRANLEQKGEPLGLRRVTLAALDACALENWHFSMRCLRDTPLEQPLTPLELQLSWRVTDGHDFLGANAVRARRERGLRVRATSFVAEAEIGCGQAVRFGDQRAGEVLAAGWSPTSEQWVGIALLALSAAHPWITGLAIEAGVNAVPIATRTPPLVNNRSLHVDPHRHSYRTRAQDTFPPLVVNR